MQRGLHALYRVLSEKDYTYGNAGNRLTNTTGTQLSKPNGGGQIDGNAIVISRMETYAYDRLKRLAAVGYGEKQGDRDNVHF